MSTYADTCFNCHSIFTGDACPRCGLASLKGVTVTRQNLTVSRYAADGVDELAELLEAERRMDDRS